MPVLYHHYTGHDNNRDWYAFTQVETQMTVDSLHNLWHPQIVNDIHQQGSERGAAVHSAVHGSDRAQHRPDPHLRRERARARDDVAAHRAGKDGDHEQLDVRCVDAEPRVSALPRRRAHSHGDGECGHRVPAHDTVRLAASGRGYDSKVSSWNFLVPWQGGTWTIGNIVDYQTSASWALLAGGGADAHDVARELRARERARGAGQARRGAREVAGRVS